MKKNSNNIIVGINVNGNNIQIIQNDSSDFPDLSKMRQELLELNDKLMDELNQDSSPEITIIIETANYFLDLSKEKDKLITDNLTTNKSQPLSLKEKLDLLKEKDKQIDEVRTRLRELMDNYLTKHKSQS